MLTVGDEFQSDLPLPQRRPRGLPRRRAAAAADPRHADARAARQLPLAAGDLAAVNSSAERCSTGFGRWSPRPSATPSAPAAGPRSSCCLTESRAGEMQGRGKARLERRGDRARAAAVGEATPSGSPRRGRWPRRLRELADAGRPARRDGRPAAGVHPRRRLRGGARARRPRPLRRRRARLLVRSSRSRTCCGPAARDRQPARRRGALRGALVAGLRRQRRRALAAAAGGRAAARTSGRCSSGRSARRRRGRAGAAAGRARAAPGDGASAARRPGWSRRSTPRTRAAAALLRDPRRAARGGAALAARRAGRARDERLRLRPGAADPAAAAGGGWRTCAS